MTQIPVIGVPGGCQFVYNVLKLFLSQITLYDLPVLFLEKEKASDGAVMFKKVLIPLDGSNLGERSLEIADALVLDEGAELILLRIPVVYNEVGMSSTQVGDWHHSEAERYLKAIQTRQDHPKLTVRTQVTRGDEARVIVETAVSEQVDLMIMSAMGRSGFGQSMLGSVAERVLRSAPCAMFVSRSDAPIKNMLITLDGSKLSEEALRPGLEVARRLGAAVTLMRVCPGPAFRDSQRTKLKQTGRLNADITSRLEMDSQGYLAHVVKREKLDRVVKTAVLQGPVASTIIDYAEGFDLVCMATHGFSAQTSSPYGQITEKVMRWVDASLLIVRS